MLNKTTMKKRQDGKKAKDKNTMAIESKNQASIRLSELGGKAPDIQQIPRRKPAAVLNEGS